MNDLEFPDLELPELPQEPVEQENVPNESTELKEQDEAASAFYSELKERGYVFSEEDFDGSWDSIDRYFETLPQAVLNSVVSTFPDTSKDIMKFLATAGDNVTVDEIKEFFNSYFDQQQAPDLDSLDSARDYLESVYLKNGMKPKAVTILLDSLEEDDELVSTAKEEFTKANKQTEKIIEKKQAENEAVKKQQQEFASSVYKELMATEWKHKEEVKKVLSGNTMNTILNDVFKSPKALVQLADILRLYKNGSFDLTPFQNQAETKVVKSIKDRLGNSFSSAGTNRSASNSDDSNKNPHENLIPIFD